MANILIVDDNRDICGAMMAIFRKIGHDARCAMGGLQALESIDLAAPDVVLLDIMMPGMSGIDVLDRIRSDPRTAALPVFMFSALDDLDVQEIALAHGADAFWVKGRVDLEALRHCIERHIDSVTRPGSKPDHQ